jgi:hypothetical protein
MSETLEMVLDFGMFAVPASDERREMREGVSDCVEGRLEDIMDTGQTAVGNILLGTTQEEEKIE